MAVTLQAEARNATPTKSERKQLRAQGKVPAVVYGKKVTQTSIAIDQKELLALLRTSPNAVIEMDLPQWGKQPVMINEVQRDPISRQLLHVDLHQINMDEPVNTTVRLEIVGEPAGVQEGGILQIQNHEVDVRCLPTQIPASIPVDVSGLAIGSSFLVSDLVLPAGIELKSTPTDVIATILAPQKEPAAEPVDDEPAAEKADTPAGAGEEANEEVKAEA
ncbi:50S ribosomal protein L25 [Paenibacillus sp. GD4]|jgi:large subunit ribosomal protein L25|uniref:50S ribosomal protein L25 n=1 Tax=Paenibacillus sp. GD4 TaxID=3068890 RepID=UPI002796658E|nr:50S ribosomal protein L25 [Paenibacillus sp. GD4]MDQ1910949.1 50S ribosomal protein L25 [Paenibacillus sp. GD4]